MYSVMYYAPARADALPYKCFKGLLAQGPLGQQDSQYPRPYVLIYAWEQYGLWHRLYAGPCRK